MSISQTSTVPALVGSSEALDLLYPANVRPSADWLRKLARANKVTHRRIGRRFLFKLSELEADLDSNFLHRARH